MRNESQVAFAEARNHEIQLIDESINQCTIALNLRADTPSFCVHENQTAFVDEEEDVINN